MEGGYLAVARLKKPHGLKGEVVLWALTDEPDEVLAAGRELTPIDEAGVAIGEPVVIERSRPYHRQWLVSRAPHPTRVRHRIRGNWLGRDHSLEVAASLAFMWESRLIPLEGSRSVLTMR